MQSLQPFSRHETIRKPGGATNHSYGGGESGQDEGDCCGDNEDEEEPQRGEAVFEGGIDETMNHNYGGDVGGSLGSTVAAMVKMKIGGKKKRKDGSVMPNSPFWRRGRVRDHTP